MMCTPKVRPKNLTLGVFLKSMTDSSSHMTLTRPSSYTIIILLSERGDDDVRSFAITRRSLPTVKRMA